MRKQFLLAASLLFSILTVYGQVDQADKATAISLVEKNAGAIGVSQQEIDNSIVTNTYITPGSDIRMVYLQQIYKGIPVYNQLHVLAFRNGKAVSVAGTRIFSVETKVNKPDAVPGIDPVRAVKTAFEDVNAGATELIIPQNISNEGKRFDFGAVGVSSENVYAELIWFPVEDERAVKLAWQVFVAPYNSSAYWLIRVDALNNTVISKENLTVSCNWGPTAVHDHPHTAAAQDQPRTEYVTKRADEKKWDYKNFVVNTATYRIVKYPAESPIHPGGSPSLHTDPWLLSPGNATTLGWHDDGAIVYDSTRGNNVFAYDDRDANNLPGRSGLSTTPQPALTMDFVPDFSLEPTVRTPAPNQQFNTTNLFYWNNLIHDLTYIYGFTETIRNYQNSNMGRGGVGGDYVLAEAQDGGGSNNANFSPGADGTRGRMQMYLWTAPTPDRDGDVDNGIIVHEYTHGISNRMTGTGAGCLSVVEQMGEGWSDYLGLMMTHNWATATPADGFNNPRGIGTYALNQPITGPGIRQYRYTTNMAINPMTYANLPSVAVPHGVGTIWCTALWDMTWYIIQQAGINSNLFNPAGLGGNAIALKLVIEGLRLQPCNPGFITGRNGILKADTLFFGAQYSCAILEAFARRGMGVGASQGSASVRGDEIISFDNGKPAITTHPQDASVCAGSSHTFSIVSTGVNLSYQWRLSTDGGVNYNDIGGATLATYSLSGITPAMNNYRYRCVVSGCPPSVTSTVAILTVTSPPSVTTSPTDVTVCEGASANFALVASGAGTLYQWQVSTNGGANYSNISGATSATLNLTAVTPSMNNNRYRCALSNAICTTPVYSSGAILTVNANTAITVQPAGTTICQGAGNTLCVTAAGTNLAYQWESSDVSCSGPWTSFGPNAACVAVTPTITTYYRTKISGICGPQVTSNCVTVTVINPVTIANQPVNREMCSGGNSSFSVTANSNETINYQWQVSTDGINWNNVANNTVYSGATTATLNITGATTSLSGNRYRNQMTTGTCLVPINSVVATLTVRQLPTVTLSASPLTSLLPGQLTMLTATPSAPTGGVLSTLWFLDNNQVPNAGNSRQVNVEQVGSYRVTIQETFGSGVTCSNQSSEVVIDAKASQKLFIFPSPNNGRFTVSYYNSAGGSTQRRIIILDSRGSKVYDRQFPITGPYTLLNIDLRSASRGIYFVSVGDAAGNKLIDGKVHVR